jgi:L-serine dehydratase
VTIEPKLSNIREMQSLPLRGLHSVEFRESQDLVFHKHQTLSRHPNGMRFSAFDSEDRLLDQRIYYSIGGGFIECEGESRDASRIRSVPYFFRSARELLSISERHHLPIWKIVLENEKSWHTEGEIRAYIDKIWTTMRDCINRGLHADGILPGGLNVRRRAPALAKKLLQTGEEDPLYAVDWVDAFAMAVNEENAAGGRIVTAPTNGAAGVIPAVAHYYQSFVKDASPEGLVRFFLTAAAIGILYKENASISGAEVGCQGEVGVACSMAAGGLVAALGGTNQQVEYAAEIGMEHNLGMTCDPIAGLVQIPCIERNAMGAVKAINACRIAMRESGKHKISLDDVIKTMYETGRDMQSRYKETSLGGLATLNIIEC